MSAGLKISEAHSLFREYVDDPDLTFLTNSQVQRYLEFGLEQWRQLIRQFNPHLYAGVCEFSASTTTDSSYSAQVAATKPRRFSLDLGSDQLRSSLTNGNQEAVMGKHAISDWYHNPAGPPPAAGVLQVPPIDVVLDVYRYANEQKYRLDRYRPLSGAKTQELSGFSYTYYMEGNVLQFNTNPPNNFIVEYFPMAKFRMVSTDTTNFIEDNLLPQYHELVVLLAAKRYMIRDQSTNQVLLGELAAQMQSMIDYLSRSQLRGSKDQVSYTMHF